jgi:hypothetical protein
MPVNLDNPRPIDQNDLKFDAFCQTFGGTSSKAMGRTHREESPRKQPRRFINTGSASDSITTHRSLSSFTAVSPRHHDG